MFNFKNPVFSKLYRYYCGKLLQRIWVIAIYFFYFLFIIFAMGNLKSSKEFLSGVNSWQERLAVFWLISFGQLFLLMSMISPLVSHLVGRGLGWEELKKGKFFRMPKISREEDIKVLIFTPNVDRKTVIWAKLAAAFTYFLAINLILSLSLVVYFLAATSLGVVASCSFLLLNGIGFGLVNFCLIVPFLFYQQEGGSFLVYFLCFIFLVFIFVLIHFSWGFITQYPLVFGLLSIPFYLLTGYCFFSLYRKKFLNQDLG